MAIFAKVGPIEGLKPLEPLLAGTEHSIAAGAVGSRAAQHAQRCQQLLGPNSWMAGPGRACCAEWFTRRLLIKKNKIQNLILKTDLSVTRVAFLTRIYVYKTPELSLIVGK